MARGPTSTDTAIRVRDLRKRYGRNQAVDGFDLDVYRGETFALLGPNGAGKTTSVEILEGFRKADSGEVAVLGEDPSVNSRRWLDRVGIVPQGLGTFDDLKVSEVISHFGSCYSQPLRTGEVVEMVGLSGKSDALCRSLSGGQRRRVDVALALVGDPELIFLDEPTTGLDPDARRHAWELVELMAEKGKTTLLTTHYLEEAEALADRVGIIVAGRMLAVGTPADVGGRSGERTTVSFDRGPGLTGVSLPELPVDDAVISDGGSVEVAAERSTETVLRLINWGRQQGIDELENLTVHRPSLEQTYLRMIHDAEKVATESAEATEPAGVA